MAVDPHAPHHLVLDLDQIARVEEVGGGEERILDPLRVRVEAAMEPERVGLGVRGLGLAMHLSGTADQICNDIYAASSRAVKNIVPVRPEFTEADMARQ